MTEQERYRRLESLFHQWSSLATAQREECIDALSGEEPALAQDLRAMFSQVNEAGESVIDGLVQQSQALVQPGLMPDTIGPYRVLGLLGEGGMGRVYEAEQFEPVRRKVAIKLTRSGLDNAGVIARFHGERQALAVLEHPNIAHIFDVGTHIDGRPWFAMELVPGVPITQWALERDLGLRERLELLLPVCDAIQHAHRKGVIHRDLKPGNILVCELDGKGVPKIIDFGIAKAVDPAPDQLPVTQAGELIGTPEYMSPEQASFGAIDIDTRSDVYALGLVLFELLVGQLPVTLEDLRRVAFDEMCRRIREDEPPRPSVILNRTRPSIRGAMTSAEWARRIEGDLDAVVMKALAKDREQRYGSAAGLAEDLRRFLADQPVQAKPPSWPNRLRKWARRNRAISTAAAFSLLAMAAAGAMAARSYIDVRNAVAATSAAQQDSEATTAFLLSLFKAADPRSEPAQNPTARELLGRGMAALSAPAAVDVPPRARLRMLESLGEAAWSLGDYAQADVTLQQAQQAHATLQPPEPARHAGVLDRLGSIARDRGDMDAAADYHGRAIRLFDEAGLARTDEAMRANNNLAIVRRRQGDLAAASALYTTVISWMRETKTEPTQGLASALLNLAAVQGDQGQSDQAIASQQQALAVFQRLLPADHPHFAVIYNNMSVVARSTGRLREALALIRQARDNDAKNLPPGHPDRADGMHNEAAILIRLGDLPAAEALLLEGRALLEQSLGAGNPRTFVHTGSLGEIALLRGLFGEAISSLSALMNDLPVAPETLRQRVTSQRKLAMAQRGARLPEAATSATQYLQMATAAGRAGDVSLANLLLALIALDGENTQLAAMHFEAALDATPECRASACVLDQGSTQLLRAQYLARVGSAQAIDAVAMAVEHKLWSALSLDHPDLQPLHQHPRWATLRAALADRVVREGVATSSVEAAPEGG